MDIYKKFDNINVRAFYTYMLEHIINN